MVLRAYSIFDVKGDFYGVPFFSLSDKMALRTFADIVNDPQSTASRHPEDFSFFCIGSFSDATGLFDPFERPQFLSSGVSVKNLPEVVQAIGPDDKQPELFNRVEKVVS